MQISEQKSEHGDHLLMLTLSKRKNKNKRHRESISPRECIDFRESESKNQDCLRKGKESYSKNNKTHRPVHNLGNKYDV